MELMEKLKECLFYAIFRGLLFNEIVELMEKIVSS